MFGSRKDFICPFSRTGVCTNERGWQAPGTIKSLSHFAPIKNIVTSLLTTAMTIRVERHALLRVISTTPSPSCNPSLDPLICEDEEFVIVELPEKKAEQQQHPFFDPATTDDDQTIDSSDDDYSADSTESRVSFADNLVTDVWTRPYTPVEDVPSLFYDSDTIAQVR